MANNANSLEVNVSFTGEDEALFKRLQSSGDYARDLIYLLGLGVQKEQDLGCTDEALLNNGSASTGPAHGATVNPVLLIDAGDAYFEWYLLKGKEVNRRYMGGHPRSTNACARAIAEQIGIDSIDDRDSVAKIERALTQASVHFTVGGRSYKVLQFSGLIDSVFGESVMKMMECLYSLADIQSIFLTHLSKTVCPVEFVDDAIFSTEDGLRILSRPRSTPFRSK